MAKQTEIERSDLLAMTSEIVSAYVSGNALGADELAGFVAVVFGKLDGLTGEAEPALVGLVPAVTIRKSVTPDYLVCLEDGRKLKMLKRHLMTAYGMTPADYRAKWGLPPNYPMVAPNYALMRQELAKKIGLGRKPAPEPQKPAPKKRGRRKAA